MASRRKGLARDQKKPVLWKLDDRPDSCAQTGMDKASKPSAEPTPKRVLSQALLAGIAQAPPVRGAAAMR